MSIDSHYLDAFYSFEGMIKKSEGFFKSLKHSNFVLKNMVEKRNSDLVLTSFGYSFDEKNHFVSHISGTYSWADYGSRSKIPYIFAYVFDKYGLLKKYKIGGNGNGRDGWSACPSKCKLVWERKNDADLPQWHFEEEKQKEEKVEIPWDFFKEKKEYQGKILSIKDHYTNYSYHGEHSLKMLMMDNRGFKVWGTLPSKISEAEVGDEISFIAKLKPSDEDSSFGFFSRPSKPKIIKKAEK